MKNDFGEEISDEKVAEIAKRVAKLPDDLKDGMWAELGLVYTGAKEHGMKALLPKHLEELKHGEADSTILTLVTEWPFKEIIAALEKAEAEAKKS